MRVVSLGSGSSGNALFVEAGPQGRTRLLVDAGLSVRTIEQRLLTISIAPSQLSGILVTHEHSDHVLGIPMVMKRYAVPIIADARTLEAIKEGIKTGAWRSDTGEIVPSHNSHMLSEPSNNTDPLFTPFPVGSRRTLGDIEVTSFATSHDAVAPCGYRLSADGFRVCIITDTGKVTPEMLKAISRVDLLILESNHDRERLLAGPYPSSLKRRILSASGHLSNAQAASAVRRAWSRNSVRCLWLAHLSRTNNTPALAITSMRTHLQNAGLNLSQVTIAALPPGMGEIWDSSGLWHNLSLF